MKILALILFSSSVFAASDLVKEFTRRRKTVHTAQTREVFIVLRGFDKRPEDIRELEMLNDRGKFAVKFNNDDVCFGDTETVSIECYNAIGFRTLFAAGDTD
ncbi:MAG: hypothetical protein VXV96_14965 [Bdellovibrionota bacterium]|jgi:hypothetical protein|nr:hypothetical protein [Bdellovibrionota bacterium]